MMQHYGAATRFLDFTTQLYTALFFALEDYSLRGYNDCYPAIYCINRQNLLKANSKNPILNKLHSYIDGDEDDINVFLNQLLIKPIQDPDIMGVLPYQPYFKNDRMHIQDGLFLVPLNSFYSFEVNLLCQFQKTGKYTVKESMSEDKLRLDEINRFIQENKISLLKIIINKELKRDLYNQLALLNKDHRHLYPDIQGIALYCKTPTVFESKNLLKELHYIDDQDDIFSKAMKSFHKSLNFDGLEHEEIKSITDNTKTLFRKVLGSGLNIDNDHMKIFVCLDNIVRINMNLLIHEIYNYDYSLLSEIDYYYESINQIQPYSNNAKKFLFHQWYTLSIAFNNQKIRKECLNKALEYLDEKTKEEDSYKKIIAIVLFGIAFIEENIELQQKKLQQIINYETEVFKTLEYEFLLDARLRLFEICSKKEEKMEHLNQAKIILEEVVSSLDTSINPHNVTLMLYSKYICLKFNNKHEEKILKSIPKYNLSSVKDLEVFSDIYQTFSFIVVDLKEKEFYLNKAKHYYKRLLKIEKDSVIAFEGLGDIYYYLFLINPEKYPIKISKDYLFKAKKICQDDPLLQDKFKKINAKIKYLEIDSIQPFDPKTVITESIALNIP